MINYYLKEGIRYSVWPLVYFGLFAGFLTLIGTAHVALATLLIGGVLALIITVVMLITSHSQVTHIQAGAMGIMGLLAVIAQAFIFPSVVEKKGVTSVVVYKDGKQHKMDVVTVDNENVSFFFPADEAKRIADINDTSKVFVTLEYLYDKSSIVKKNYSTTPVPTKKNIIGSF